MTDIAIARALALPEPPGLHDSEKQQSEEEDDENGCDAESCEDTSASDD